MYDNLPPPTHYFHPSTVAVRFRIEAQRAIEVKGGSRRGGKLGTAGHEAESSKPEIEFHVLKRPFSCGSSIMAVFVCRTRIEPNTYMETNIVVYFVL